MGSASSRPASSVLNLEETNEKRSVDSLAASFQSVAIRDAVSADGSLSLSNVRDWEADVAEDPRTQLARTILSHSDIRSALISRQAVIADTHIFNHEIDFKTAPITNQASSGRCWLFATTNVLRYEIMKKLKLEKFQLSQVSMKFFVRR